MNDAVCDSSSPAQPAAQPAHSEDFEPCGSFDCSLPKGHNMGRADIPANHHSEEIGQRLREEHRFRFGFHEDGGEAPSLYTDAADLIEAQHDENKQLRDALGVILAGLTDALGDPMGARPSQVTTLYSIASHAMRPIQPDSPEEADRG